MDPTRNYSEHDLINAREQGKRDAYNILAAGVPVFAHNDDDLNTPIGVVKRCYEEGDESVGIPDFVYYTFEPVKS